MPGHSLADAGLAPKRSLVSVAVIIVYRIAAGMKATLAGWPSSKVRRLTLTSHATDSVTLIEALNEGCLGQVIFDDDPALEDCFPYAVAKLRWEFAGEHRATLMTLLANGTTQFLADPVFARLIDETAREPDVTDFI